jgi:DNA-3-methyladenine glycosylase
MTLPIDFYISADVLSIAHSLLGKMLVTRIDGHLTSGIIVETEAYAGVDDQASHARNGKVTARNKVMYQRGGISYVYLCYGVHHLFNVVTGGAGLPHAVLIRAIEPVDGIATMLQRRRKHVLTASLTSGPGVLTAALGINMVHNSLSLLQLPITVEDMGGSAPQIVASTRVGVAYAGADALLPYRFCIADNPYVSKARGIEN